MKKTILFTLAISSIALSTQSCKKLKAGCTDSTAENYNVYAKLDDGSCMYHSSSQITLTDANWNFIDPYYQGTITWESLTQEVIDRGSYSVFYLDGNSWVELPHTYSYSPDYSSYYQANVSEGQVVIRRYDSDLVDSGSPGYCTFKVVAWW